MTPTNTITLKVDGMSCGHCVAAVRQALESVPGVEIANVNIGGATLRASGDAPPVEAIRAAVEDAGYFAEVVVR